MDFNYVITKVFEGLTGNAEKDINYLMDQMEKYKESENAREIIRALGRKLYEILPNDRKSEINRAIGNISDSVDSTLQEALFQIKLGDCIKAEEILEHLVNDFSEMFKEDDECVYMCFNNPIEHCIYDNVFKPKKAVRNATIDFEKIYYYYGYCLSENRKTEEAIAALNQSLKYNPVSVQTIYELAEVYKVKKNFDEFLRLTKQALELSYTAGWIARGYRNLGFYYVEIEKYEIAIALIQFSLFFENNNNATSELYYIAEKTGSLPKQLEINEIHKLLEENHIPFGANDIIIAILFEFGKYLLKQNDIDGSIFCFKNLYELTSDEKIKNILLDLLKDKEE